MGTVSVRQQDQGEAVATVTLCLIQSLASSFFSLGAEEIGDWAQALGKFPVRQTTSLCMYHEFEIRGWFADHLGRTGTVVDQELSLLGRVASREGILGSSLRCTLH
jgi:hypothetical protein